MAQVQQVRAESMMKADVMKGYQGADRGSVRARHDETVGRRSQNQTKSSSESSFAGGRPFCRLPLAPGPFPAPLLRLRPLLLLGPGSSASSCGAVDAAELPAAAPLPLALPFTAAGESPASAVPGDAVAALPPFFPPFFFTSGSASKKT